MSFSVSLVMVLFTRISVVNSILTGSVFGPSTSCLCRLISSGTRVPGGAGLARMDRLKIAISTTRRRTIPSMNHANTVPGLIVVTSTITMRMSKIEKCQRASRCVSSSVLVASVTEKMLATWLYYRSFMPPFSFCRLCRKERTAHLAYVTVSPINSFSMCANVIAAWKVRLCLTLLAHHHFSCSMVDGNRWSSLQQHNYTTLEYPKWTSWRKAMKWFSLVRYHKY